MNTVAIIRTSPSCLRLTAQQRKQQVTCCGPRHQRPIQRLTALNRRRQEHAHHNNGIYSLTIPHGHHQQDLPPRQVSAQASTSTASSETSNDDVADDMAALRSKKKAALVRELEKYAPNGLSATPEDQKIVEGLVVDLEGTNPTDAPAKSELMAGFWKMLYTDMEPAPSSGKLGPFIGDVYQDLRPEDSRIVNVLKVGFPPIRGGLRADQEILDDDSWRITFDDLQQYLGVFKVQTKEFPRDPPLVRVWKMTYLDEELRVVRAKVEGDSDENSFLFILRRCEEERFVLGK